MCTTWSVFRLRSEGVVQPRQDDVPVPEVRVVVVVGRLNIVAALVPVGLRRRLTHVSSDTFGRGEIVHVYSKGL